MWGGAFDGAYLAKYLGDSIFGKNLIVKEAISSSNVLLKKYAKEGAPEGTVVVADEQTAGLGRMGRQWLSKKCENLLFSVLLRPDLPPHKVFVLTMVFSLAGIDAVKEVSGLNAGIKWPNDIYMGQKKLGGVLTEFSVLGGKVDYVVLGMGLNVNWRPEGEQTVLYETSSIRSETGERISRERLLTELLKQLEIYYLKALKKKEGRGMLYERWNERSLVLGKSVVVETGRGRVCGEAAEIDENGALMLITDEGKKERIFCGDVSVKVDFHEHKKDQKGVQ